MSKPNIIPEIINLMDKYADVKVDNLRRVLGTKVANRSYTYLVDAWYDDEKLVFVNAGRERELEFIEYIGRAYNEFEIIFKVDEITIYNNIPFEYVQGFFED